MASLSEISALARNIQRQAPTLSVGTHLGSYMREEMQNLAHKCGLTWTICYKALDADLISIYLVALKDANGAKITARKIAMRLDDSLLGTPSTAPHMPPLEEPAPHPHKPHPHKPHPHKPQAPQGPSLDTVRDLIKREVKEGALDPLQAALERTVETFYSAIAKVPIEAVDAMREEMATVAHEAATNALKSMTPTRLEIVRGTDPAPHNLGLVHRDTAKIINALSAGVNVYLHGPAGSGKTTVARKVAEAFSLQFYFAAKVESEYQLMGFKDAKGETVRTQFREAYEHGGVFLFDEMDASSPSAVVALNAALANGICPFPDAIIQRHKDFICLGAGNTKLTGANRQYAGRNQLDAASIDRFAFIEFGYDDDLERALATDLSWCKYVQRVRAVIAERGLSHLVTPRSTYDGCKLLARGLDRDTVAAMCVYKGLDADTVSQIERAL